MKAKLIHYTSEPCITNVFRNDVLHFMKAKLTRKKKSNIFRNYSSKSYSEILETSSEQYVQENMVTLPKKYKMN